MTGATLQAKLADFATNKRFHGKGPLCVALVITQHARDRGLPLDKELLVTEGGGQVLGLGKSAVQAVLKRHGIDRLLASEGGRTSRGSLSNMREYVDLLNGFEKADELDLEAVENFWINRVHAFFAGKPFKIKLDASKSLRAVVRDVIKQAGDRQKTTPGMYYAGAVLQHLVGAKLDAALGPGKFEHNSFTTADSPGARKGDFLVGDVAIHVTTAPGEGVIDRCRENLDDGIRPVLVTIQDRLAVADGLANNVGLGDRIDIFEIEQFVALNVYELGKFGAEGRKTAVADIIRRYNEIVEEYETDPSLKIDLRR